MNVNELIKKLISLPSYDDGLHYEKSVTDFLIAYVRTNYPWLSVTIQEVAPNRCNILLKDSASTRLLVIDQLDTVVPDSGWQTDPLIPIERDEKVYGLGASDSKGNIAAFLTALEQRGPTQGLAILFYVDEEYCFAGMKQFVHSSLASTLNPEFVLSIDGNGSALGLGCRGLVEFDVQINASSGHSANSTSRGALRPLLAAEQSFQSWLKTRGSQELIGSSAQIARLESGLLLKNTHKSLIFSSAGNRIPNFAQAKIEVRTDPTFTSEEIFAFWKNTLVSESDITVTYEHIFDYTGFSTSVNSVQPIYQAIEETIGNVEFLDASTFGYLDIAMLRDVYRGAALCSFGIGEFGVNHRADEYVRLSSLETGVQVYAHILKMV